MMAGFGLVAHADWSGDRTGSAAKRQAAMAVREGPGWRADVPAPVGAPMAFVHSMLARCRDRPGLLAFDFPIGLPIAFARAHLGAFAGFPAFLDSIENPVTSPFFQVAATLEEVGPQRPFFPAGRAAGAGIKGRFLARLGLDRMTLLRGCDHKGEQVAQACGIFWTQGGNQVGKAALAGWKELLWPCRRQGLDIALWPFEGPLATLAGRARLVIAESYPAEGYARMGFRRPPPLQDSDGRRSRTGKRTQAWRRFQAPAIRAFGAANRVTFSRELDAMLNDGFGTRPDGEDAFDAVVGLLAAIQVADGSRGEGPLDRPHIRTWEGWMLGRLDYPV